MEINDINLKQLIESETGSKFNRQGFIACPLHKDKTPSLSIKFHPDSNKYKFKCFACQWGGDAIDFVCRTKNLNFVKAREYLGMKVEKSKNEKLKDEIKKYIDWEITKYREGQELLGIFTFVDKTNEPIYFKAKFLISETGKKTHGYYHFEDGKVKASRGHSEVPYNLYNTIKAIQAGKAIVVVEGEKDANTINSLLRKEGYEATSFKGITDDLINHFGGARLYVCGDTGEAGEAYKWKVYNELNLSTTEFKFINLPGLQAMGDNKDVTDWIESGKTKRNLLDAFNRSLDVKSKYELQQNANGVYKWAWNKHTEEHFRDYITNFKLIEAKRIRFVDEDKEGIKLILKSNTGEMYEKQGLATVFDDVKSFKNFLGTMNLSFIGDVKVLTQLKIWIDKYFSLENEEIYKGTRFIEINEELKFLTKQGAISVNKVNTSVKANSNIAADLIEIEEITKEELKLLNKYLFKFATPEKTISILGTIINNLAIHQVKSLKGKLHHLLVVGESGSGKSTVLENVIAAILNTRKNDIKSIGLTSPFGLIKELSEGNYTLLLEEFKPSSLDRFKIQKLSEIFRNAYDGTVVARGNRSLDTIEYKLDRPIVIVGEESYPNSEKALIERSCIVYLSKNERTEEHTKAMKWIIENEDILNKFGRSLISTILDLNVDEYQSMKSIANEKINELVNRPKTTAVNIHVGMQIYNKLLASKGLKETKGFEIFIVNNIKTEVLEDGEEVNSQVEKMLITFNQMLEDSRVVNPECVFVSRGGKTFIKTSEMINLLYEHTQRFGAEIVPLKLKDFKKQAKKAGYIIEDSVPTKMKTPGGAQKTVRMDAYDTDKLREIKMYEIAQPIFEVAAEVDKEFEEYVKDVPF